jgi:DNA-binding MarR family transcriptional regulator
MGNSAAKVLRLEDYLPYRLSVAANAVSQLIAHAYKDRFGLKVPEWRLIAVLADVGSLTPQALCERTVMDKVTVTRAAQSLLGRHLIKREPHASDGRSHCLRLTGTGERL